MENELSALQQEERNALCGDRHAVICVVDALRKYRSICKKLLDSRYSDGFIDGVSTCTFSVEVEEIEELRESE